MECIEGHINEIRYHKTSEFSQSGNKFLISLFQQNAGFSNQSSVTIKGEMNSPVYGWNYKLYGEWKDDKYGRHFAFDSFEPILPKSHEGMADYLARSVPEIGKVRARLIVDHFGDESFSILKTNPSRLREVAGIPRLAREQAEEFFSSDNALEIDPVAYSRLYDLLSPIRPPRKVIKSLLTNFGSNAPQFITENPYKLLDYPGMGWIRVDRFAIEVLKYDKNGIERHKKSVMEILAKEAERGHTKTDYSTLHVECSGLLKTTLDDKSLDSLIGDTLIINEDEYISSFQLFRAEQVIVEEIQRLQEPVNDRWSPWFKINEDGFDDEQKLIPEMIKSNNVSIITGVPGSGKSHSVSIIVKSLYMNGIQDIIILAPTGKAAKRNDEFIQQSLPGISIPCMTIHRALGGQLSAADQEEGIPEDEARVNRGRERFSFQHNRENPLPYSYFIIDESSMCDVSLMASLLQAIPDGSRLLIVGDHYQLPSVGPGSVLRDLIASGIPSVVLDKPRRNSGAIAQACYMIKEGKCPSSYTFTQYTQDLEIPLNWTHREIASDGNILNMIRDIHIKYIYKYGIDQAKMNIQVISPQKKYILGCNNLNRVLASIMNPDEEPLPESKSKDDDSEVNARCHDKIVRTKNGWVDLLTEDIMQPDDGYDYGDGEAIKTVFFNDKEYFISECYVVNGDTGEVEGFKGNYIFVRFKNPDRLCRLPKADARISLAYALTVHKMQGSSAPIIILPLTNYYWNTKENIGLFSRELVYTAFSRPSERLITIGRLSELAKAVSRVTINHRKTRLKSMMEKSNVEV